MEDIDLFYTTIFEEVFYLEKEAIVDAVKNKNQSVPDDILFMSQESYNKALEIKKNN